MRETVPTSVSLRPFPYPFRAALSICNDADLLTPQKFRRLHRFLSTDDETEWGPGLGLDVGGSFFMFRSPGSPNQFTVFDRLTSTMTDDGESILEYVREARHGGMRTDDLDAIGYGLDPILVTAARALRGEQVAPASVKSWSPRAVRRLLAGNGLAVDRVIRDVDAVDPSWPKSFIGRPVYFISFATKRLPDDT